MRSSLPRRIWPAALSCLLALGCGDDAAPGDMGSGGGGGGGGASFGGAPVGGTAGTTSSQAGSATGGSATGGSAGTAAGSGGGGGGGSAIDPNGGAPAGPASGRHTARPAGSIPDTTAGFWEYLPPHYGNGALYPLLVFRHGLGENGSGMLPELNKVLVHGPPKLIEADQWPESRPFVVLSVQHPGDGCSTPQEIDDFLQFALDTYDVDPKRVYLTGLSCGAIGSWNYLGEHADETVAAAVLVCGDGRPAFQKLGCGLGKVPIWAFHGEQDPTVAPAGSIETLAGLQACTNPPAVDAKLTLYPGVGHDSWTMTYDASNSANDIYGWLMTHSKP